MAIDKTIKLKVDSKDAVKGLDQVKKGVKGVDTSAKGAKSGLGGMTSAAKGLGTAFKALGIGLIIAAFMKLKDLFSGNIETARRFERISAQLSAAFDVLRDRAEEFIKSLIALKNPFKAFKDAFKGTTAEIKEEVKAIDTLTIALQGVRDEERDMLLIRAKANKIIAESRLLAEDDTKSMTERLAALKAAVAEEKRVADMEVATQNKKVEALQAVIDLGKSSEEDIATLAAERARLIELQTASILKQKRVAAEIGTFTNQIAKEEERIEKEKLARIELTNQAKELSLDITEELSNKEIDIIIKAEQKKLVIEQKTADAKETARKKELVEEKKAADEKLKIAKAKAKADEKIEKDLAQQKINMVAGSLGAVSNLIGKESAAGKALAIAQATISTYSAAAAALAPPPVGAGPILGPITAGIAVATGLKSVRDIMSTKLPGGESGGGGSLPSIDTPSVPDSPIDDVEEGPTGLGAFIPNIESITTATQPIQAYVIENEISSSQALQEELEVQATL